MSRPAEPVPDQRGRVAIVTGANSGLGLVTARQLAASGATVVLACRDAGRAEGARAQVAMQATAAAPGVVALDLADLGSVRRAAAAVARDHDAVDLLVNNAGVMAIPPMLSADGFEMQFGTNHLGHFALTALLLPLLSARPGARVVTVSSLVAWQSDVDLADLQSERAYDPWRAYARSKRANLLMAFELDRRARYSRSRLLSVAAHPGYSATELIANGPARWSGPVGRATYGAGRLLAQPAASGARSQLLAATGAHVRGGTLIGPRWLVRGPPTTVRPPRGSRSAATAAALWQMSEELTGVRARLGGA